MIECLRCKKQYIGETKRMLRERFKEHRKATNKPNHSNATAALPTHFNLPGHSSKRHEVNSSRITTAQQQRISTKSEGDLSHRKRKNSVTRWP